MTMMVDNNNTNNIADKTMRSVFVGNIPYEVTEEKLKEIFSEVGPVLSFKLVYDRDSGKPKGYGFCEYQDPDTASCAMRNLNNYEIAGRNLRVDTACTEKSRMEMQSLLPGSNLDNTYGETVTPDEAPIIISKTVASLPPEMMYDIAKQMQTCIRNNPTESRQLLLSNPQMSYALLQVLVAMKKVDPDTALTMLYPSNKVQIPQSSNTSTNNVNSNEVSENKNGISSSSESASFQWNKSNNNPLKPITSSVNVQPTPPPISSISSMTKGQDLDLRQPLSRFNDQDLRNVPFSNAFPPAQPQQQQSQPQVESSYKRDPRLQQQQLNENLPFPGMLPHPAMVHPNMPPLSMPNLPMQLIPPGVLPMLPNLPARMIPSPMSQHTGRMPQPTPTVSNNANNSVNSTPLTNPLNNSNMIGSANSDAEKAALIRKVLSFTDEELAKMPEDHRRAILALKNQIEIAKNNAAAKR